MAPHVIVSYDDTDNDRDALALANLLHGAGAALTLAYVRHAVETSPERELLVEGEAEARLLHGVALLSDHSVDHRVVVDRSTSDGLRRLALELGADVIAFGSEYRTAQGHVALGRAAQTLLENGPTALALAPAGFATSGANGLQRIGILPGTADEAAIATAFSLAERHGATVVDSPRDADLLVVGSRPEAAEGRVLVSASAAGAIEQATVPVLVTARGVPLSFETLVAA